MAAEELKKPEILIINGSLKGNRGNTGKLLPLVKKELLAKGVSVSVVVLKDIEGKKRFLSKKDAGDVLAKIDSADGILVMTGTYWSSGGDHLQRLWQAVANTEATSVWRGKPVMAVILQHSDGGSKVMDHIADVTGQLGCTMPPPRGVILSYAGQEAHRHSLKQQNTIPEPADVRPTCHNLVETARALKGVKFMMPIVDNVEYTNNWINDQAIANAMKKIKSRVKKKKSPGRPNSRRRASRIGLAK